MTFFYNLETIFQLLLAVILGGLIGIEREYRRKEAGLRTYSLVSLGAALFTIISFEIFNSSSSLYGKAGIAFDPTRIIGQIVLGIGFLGAGLIVYRQFHVEGLTTAAGLWVVAAIGTAIGAKLYFAAVFVAFLTILILAGLRIVEEKVFGKEMEDGSKK
jgi:putative Mg2+ transporter-C (MgtC) family protein